MSRAMNVDATVSETLAACTASGVTVSAATAIHSGGTRLVLTNSHDSAIMALALKAKLIDGPVRMQAPAKTGSARAVTNDTPRESVGWTRDAGAPGARKGPAMPSVRPRGA